MMAESVDAAVKERCARELGLDQPLHVQYLAWMGRMLQGDLGPLDPQPGAGDRERRPPDPAEPRSWRGSRWRSRSWSPPVGILSAARRNIAVDRFGTTFALFGICMPNFLIALLLIFVFGVTLRWLPISGYIDPVEEPWHGLRSLTCRRSRSGWRSRRS